MATGKGTRAPQGPAPPRVARFGRRERSYAGTGAAPGQRGPPEGGGGTGERSREARSGKAATGEVWKCRPRGEAGARPEDPKGRKSRSPGPAPHSPPPPQLHSQAPSPPRNVNAHGTHGASPRHRACASRLAPPLPLPSRLQPMKRSGAGRRHPAEVCPPPSPRSDFSLDGGAANGMEPGGGKRAVNMATPLCAGSAPTAGTPSAARAWPDGGAWSIKGKVGVVCRGRGLAGGGASAAAEPSRGAAVHAAPRTVWDPRCGKAAPPRPAPPHSAPPRPAPPRRRCGSERRPWAGSGHGGPIPLRPHSHQPSLPAPPDRGRPRLWVVAGARPERAPERPEPRWEWPWAEPSPRYLGEGREPRDAGMDGGSGGMDGPDWVVPGRTGPYWAALGGSGPCWALLGGAGLYCDVLDYTGQRWVILGGTRA